MSCSTRRLLSTTVSLGPNSVQPERLRTEHDGIHQVARLFTFSFLLLTPLTSTASSASHFSNADRSMPSTGSNFCHVSFRQETTRTPILAASRILGLA